MPRLAKSADIFLTQINKRWPERYKRRDGWLGKKNNHDPNIDGVVFALDIDDHLLGVEESEGGKKECQRLADELIELAKRGLDGGRIKYVAYNKRIASGTNIDQFWIWRPVRRGFDKHMHISFNDVAEEKAKSFPLRIFSENPLISEKIKKDIPKFPGMEKLSFGKKNIYVRKMQDKLSEKGFSVPEEELGRYGQVTSLVVAAFYKSIGINSGTIARDGSKFGVKAWEKLFGE
jgi:hypothetical protein